MSRPAPCGELTLSWTARAAVRVAHPVEAQARAGLARVARQTGAVLQAGDAGAFTVELSVHGATTAQACRAAMDLLAHRILPLLPGAHLADLHLAPGAAPATGHGLHSTTAPSGREHPGPRVGAVTA